MADNAAQSIKDLQKDLAALDKQLLSNNANWDKLGQTIVDSLKRGGLGLDDIFSKMKGQKDVLKLRAIIDRDALKDDVKKLQTAVDKGVKSVKIGGVEITGQKQIEQALDGYKAQLKLVPKTLAEAYDYAVKIANTLGGGKQGQQSAISKQRVKDEKDVQKIQEQTTASLQKRIELEERLKTLKPNGKAWREVKEELERVNKQTQEYLAKMGSLGTAGARQLKAYEEAGLITNADKQQVALERQQIDLLRQRMQAEEQLNRLLLQRNNATLAGKTVSPKVTDSISRLQERIDTIDKQRLGNYQNFTQTSLQRIEGMWQNHETALTNIKTQGAQSRQRILDRQTADEQKAIEQQRKLAQRYAEIESLRNQALGGKKYGELNKTELAQWQNFSTLLADVKKQMDTIESKHPGSLLKGQSLQSTDALLQQTKENIRQRDIESKRQAAAEEKRIERELAEDAKRAAKEKSDAEKQRAELEKQNIRDLQAANKAATQEADRLARAQAKARSAEAKQTFKRTDSESVSNLKRQAEIKQQIARIDHERQLRAKTNSQISTQQAEAERKSYSALQSELSKLISQQKERERLLRGTTAQASNKIGGYADRLQVQEAQRYRQELEKIGRQQEKNKRGLEDMLPTLRRLASAFGVAFSVQGLVQFGKKLIETRGQFEMQFVAMKQIIGDVDAATKIWNQTMQQALQSPFRAMQLVDYTKKLAAYRIETDKLFDTTKRLADVSAGLGVDMGRLILAYGQVKTANYLRASEVRQFTEAGVNIYGELARYFSEIEGRAVGTAEVVERVSKRMVLFSDVEKIFQRMTDEGGTFFNMQEVQADTVRGQIMKLQDAYDQMLNTIGQANDGTIRKWIGILNDLVRNWQNVAFVLKGNVNWITIIGAALYALSRNYLKGATTQTLWFSKAIMGNSKVLLKDTADIKIFSKVIGDYSLKTRVAVVATRTLQGALSKLGNVARAIWPLVVFEGAVLLIERLTRASRELKRFREELEAVTSENVGRMNEEISGYDALIKKLQKTNEGTAARKEILDEISNKYGKYLDFIVTEKTTVDELAGAYDNVVSSIRNYTAEKIREEQQQRLEKGIYDEYQDLVDSLTNKRIADAQGNQFKITKEQAKNIAKVIQQSLDKYGVADIQRILETYFGNPLELTGAGGGNAGIGNIIREYIGEYKSLNQELQDIRNDIEGETPVFSSDAEYNDYKKRVQDANVALAEQAKRNEQINNLIKENNKEQWQSDDALSKQRIANAEAELRIRRKYNLITQKEYESSLARLHGQLDDYETDYNKRLKESLQSMSSFGPFWLTLDKDARDMYNYVVSTEDALQQGTEQRNKQLKESYKGLKDSLKQYQDALAAGGDKDALNKNITWTKLMIKAIELAAKLRGIDLTDTKKTGTGKSYDSISSLISLLKEMNSEYDKLSKSAYGFAKSNQKVVESFSPAFKEIFGFAGIDISQVDTTSKRSTADAMKLVIDTLDKKNLWGKFGSDGGKKARKEFVKAWSQEDVEADIDVQVRIREDFGRQMEDAFSDFQLTLDLEKLNLPHSLMQTMFDMDAVDLADMRQKLSELSRTLLDENGVMSDDNWKVYNDWLKKIEDKERDMQRQRMKDYSKYLEYQLSERAKLEMEYAKKVAEVQSESAFDDNTRSRILRGLQEEYDKKIAKQDWEDFKGSEMYVEMMEDLTRQGTASLEEMRKKLVEVRDNSENLSPRALKEVVNALQKIDEVVDSRVSPFARIRNLGKDLKDAMKESGFDNMRDVFAADEDAKLRYQELKDEYDEIQAVIGAKQQEKEIEEQLGDYRNSSIASLQNLINKKKEEKKSEDEAIASLGVRDKSNQQEIESRTQKSNALQGEIDKYESIIKLLKQLEEAQKTIRGSSKYGNIDLGLLSVDSDTHKEQMDAAESTTKRIGIITRLWQRLRKATQESLEATKEYLNSTKDLIDSSYTLLQNFGAMTDEVSDQWKQFIDTFLDSTIQSIDAFKKFAEAQDDVTKGIAKGLATGDYIRLILSLLSAIAKVASELSLFRGARIDKEIREQQEYIDELAMAYDRLEKAIEKTVTTSGYLATYNKQIQNTYQQIAATEAQLAAAQNRKRVDQSEVNGYRSTLNELYDQLEDLQSQMQETFGGIGGESNYRSWAEEFVSEWRSAFLETGDGLDALEDHFDEFLQDWFEKQATMRIAGRMLEPLMSMIDQSVDDGILTRMELDRIKERASEIFPQLNEQLREFYETMGFGDGNGSLSGLAKAISGMSEEQADILAAYGNSIRMYAASIDLNVAAIANALGIGDASPSANPVLQQISIIARNTSSIYTLLDSVVLPGHSKGRSGIKIFLN